MDSAMLWLAWGWAGWAITTALLVVMYVATGWFGREVWRRLRRAYALHVIAYWLDRFEREGLRTFQRPD